MPKRVRLVPQSEDAGRLTDDEYARFTCAKLMSVVRHRVQSLSDYFAVIASQLQRSSTSWYRGHDDQSYELIPGALRYHAAAHRTAALDLVNEFKRTAEFKITKPPSATDDLKWLQIAQHYGVPTRLLDWTESPTAALHFACVKRPERDAVVVVLDPVLLNRAREPRRPRVFDTLMDGAIINAYLVGKTRRTPPIAITPVWNNERILLQRGAFTLHSDRQRALSRKHAPSLMAIPILKENKVRLRQELERIGVDEMSLFPEPEHTSAHLRRRACLPETTA